MAAKKLAPAPVAAPSLEDLLTGPRAFGLVSASPVQRAICRVIDGLPLGDLAEDPHVIAAVGGPEAVAYLQAPPEKPLEVYIIGGSRIGKTLIAAAVLFKASQTIDLTGLGHGDEPRCPVLSLDKDKANACYLHLTKNIEAKGSALGPYLVDKGRNELDSPAAWLRHPSGRSIQVCVTANKAAGNAVVSYFLGSVVFDEACKMAGAGEAVVNFEEARDNALGRLLPGAQLVAIGSPWAPFGPMYEAKQTRHGKPGPDLVVIHARGDLANPWWWTPKRIAGLKPNVRRTEVDAEFLTPEEAIFDEALLLRHARPTAAPLPRRPGLAYGAAMDPATRSNAWTLLVGTYDGPRLVVALARQWLPEPGARLSARAVLREVAEVCREYGVDTVITDQWSSDAITELADEVTELALIEHVWTQPNKVDAFSRVETLLSEGLIELPRDPGLIEDLKLVKRRPTQDALSIHLPERKTTTGLKRHCDYAPALALLAGLDLTPDDTDKEEETWETREIRAREQRQRERQREAEADL